MKFIAVAADDVEQNQQIPATTVAIKQNPAQF